MQAAVRGLAVRSFAQQANDAASALGPVDDRGSGLARRNGDTALGIAGGIPLPLWLWQGRTSPSATLLLHTFVTGQFLMLLGGELLERYLFFTAVVASRMPGGLRT